MLDFEPENDDLYKDFIEEASDHLGTIESIIYQNKITLADTRPLFSAFHNLNSISGFVGLTQFKFICKSLETYLFPFRELAKKHPKPQKITFNLKEKDLDKIKDALDHLTGQFELFIEKYHEFQDQ